MNKRRKFRILENILISFIATLLATLILGIAVNIWGVLAAALMVISTIIYLFNAK